ncbi:hypothetical protein N7G274_001575 [Stereocaulon virgatum]|uniref:Uncharacterized protein n=1 Tax=Stereocaulon virgatum TaxID=373712 RepID=A0ABR4ALY2_9LECA
MCQWPGDFEGIHPNQRLCVSVGCLESWWFQDALLHPPASTPHSYLSAYHTCIIRSTLLYSISQKQLQLSPEQQRPILSNHNIFQRIIPPIDSIQKTQLEPPHAIPANNAVLTLADSPGLNVPP